MKEPTPEEMELILRRQRDCEAHKPPRDAWAPGGFAGMSHMTVMRCVHCGIDKREYEEYAAQMAATASQQAALSNFYQQVLAQSRANASAAPGASGKGSQLTNSDHWQAFWDLEKTRSRPVEYVELTVEEYPVGPCHRTYYHPSGLPKMDVFNLGSQIFTWSVPQEEDDFSPSRPPSDISQDR